MRQHIAVPWETDGRIFAGNRILSRSECGIWIYEAPPVNLVEGRGDPAVWREIKRIGRDLTRQFISLDAPDSGP